MARNFGRSQRMPKHWERIGSSALIGFTGDATGLAANPLDLPEAWTCLRLIGEYIIAAAATTIVAADFASIAVGIGVVSTDAATLGASAMPDPAGEPDFPWLYWASHSFSFLTTSDPEPSGAAGSVRKAFDVKSMRKIKPRESLVMVAQYTDVTGAPPLNWGHGITRVLVAQ